MNLNIKKTLKDFYIKHFFRENLTVKADNHYYDSSYFYHT